MKALIYEGPKQMVIREAETPVPAGDEALIRVAYSGICGSELSGYLGHNALRKPALIFGHEFSGTIAALGSRVSPAFGLAEGMRVTANPLVTCGVCDKCKAGKQQLCRSRKLLSAALPGSNAEYVKVPAAFVYPLPKEITLQQGALAEPAACAVRAAELAACKPGETVLIFGMGPIGLLILQAVKLYGVGRIIAVDTNPDRLALAKALGADGTVNPAVSDTAEEVGRLAGSRGVQAAIDAVGAAVTREACIRLTDAGGRVVFTGLHEESSPLPVNLAIRNEIAVTGSFAYGSLHFETALRLLAEGAFSLGDGILEAPLEEGAAWFDRLLGPAGNVSKVLLVPQGTGTEG